MQGKIIIPADQDSRQVVELLIEELQQLVTLSEEDVFRTRLVLSESIQNAVVHGNRNDPTKTVVIEYAYDKEAGELFFCISDQGKGFDLGSVADPTAPENRTREGGRGVYFLRAFTKGLSYCQEEKSMKFSIKIPAQP